MNHAAPIRDDSDEGEWIIKPDMSEPAQGFFSVKLGKNHLTRALAVFSTRAINHNVWAVYLDGTIISDQKEMDWRKAFGKLFAHAQDLTGTRISRDEYIALITQRRKDVAMGIDLDAPFDSTKFPVP